MTAHILVVDVEPAARKQTKFTLEQKDFSLTLKSSFREALQLLKQHGSSVELILVSMPQDLREGLDFIESVSDMGLEIPIVAQMAQGNLGEVAEVLRRGAFDFIVKPASRDRLFGAISSALKVTRAGKHRIQRRNRPQQVQFSSIISASQSMMRVVTLARKAAHNHIPIALEGEAGVGKMLIARAIHSASDRSTRPFVVVDCANFANLGQGAEAATMMALWQAKLQEADGATLYLNEVGDLPAKFQAKLLELVQSIQTVGLRHASGAGRSAVRIISSSSKDLIEEVRTGRFRDDLYYRLNVYPIAIPALRRRREDITHLVRLFAEQMSAEQRKPRVVSVRADAMALLLAFDWPGNIRQLENALYRAVTLTEHSELVPADFPQIAAQVPSTQYPDDRSMGPALIISNQGGAREEQPYEAALMDGVERAVKVNSLSQNTADKGAISSINEDGDLRPLAEIEEELIRFALGFYRGQMSQVARKLGIGRSTLYRKLKDYGIDPDHPLRDVA